MRNFTFNGSKIFRLNFFIAFFLLISVSASAQFYTKHYIAPAPWQYFNDANEIVIATNSTSSVSIVVSKSDGTFITNLTAIKGTPAVYRFSGAPNTTTTKAYTFDTVLNGIGLIVTASAPVAINLRNVASDALSGTNIDKEIKGNAALTSFGDAGLGVRFRVGYYRDGSLGNFNGYGDQRPIYTIMATVDNTTIKINNTVTATLNSGQSYLFKAPIGTLVESSNPIVMNTSAAIDTPDGCGDSAYNQIPPEAVLGTEYFLERGTGNSTAEQTTVVATKDNTSVKVESFSTSGANMNATTITLANAGDSYTFVNGYNNTSFTASHVVADKRVAVYSGTAQGCEVDISTIAPVSECGGSNFIETAKFRNYNSGTLDYFGYILLRSATDVVTVNGTNIATISGIGARYQIGTSGWYIINFNSVQIGSPDVLSIASNSKMTVSIVQQAGGFSMAGFFSNFAAQPEDPTLTYISGGGCTNNTAELTTPAGFAPYQWYYNGVAITGANAATYTATKTGAYSVGSTLVCGTQTQSKPVNVTLCTDLGITKTVDNTAPCLGSNVEFTVKVSNLGGNNVSGVSVNDLLPSGYAYVGSTPSVGVYDSGTGIWTIGDVEAQTSMTLKIVATVNSSGNYTNTASLPNAIDTNTANNSASAAVTPKVANLVVTNPAAVCSPSTVDLTVPAITSGSSSNLTLSYWTNSNASTALSSPSSVSTAGTYYIKAVSSDGCTFIKPVVVTVNSPSSNNSISGATNCATGSVTLTASGGSGTYLWSTGDTSKTITVTTDGSYTVQRISSSGCVTSASAPAVVTFKPVAPTASSQTFCSSENKKVGDLVASGAALKWYNASTNGTQYAVNATLVTGTYYVSQTTNGCESLRTSVSVTVNSTSSAPVASAQSYCAADNKKISDLALTVSGSNLKWYSSNSSSTALATNTVLTSTTYYVSQTANSCGESARTAVAVTINTVPSAPTASSQTFCAIDAKKVSDLTATGSNLKWYSASTNGTLYTGSETLVTGSYYVSQTNTCGESTRRTVAVTVNNTAAPTASSQTFCAIDNKKVSDLTASGSNLKWYSASTGGTLYTGTETLSTGNYYVSQTLNSCESTRTLVSVTVNNTAAPTASAQTFCFDDVKKVSDLTASGSNLKWYSASTGGTLYAGTETLSSGNYYVSQTLNSCESTRTLVSVTVNPTPAAPTITAGGATTFCTGGSVVLTSSGGNSYLWSTGATTQSITVSASGAYSVKVGNASGCLSASSASTTVTVDVIPSAPAASAQTFCSADAKKVSDLLPSGTGIKWYSASTGGTLYAGTEVLATGTYFVSQTTSGCESTRTSVSVTVNTTPSAPAASAQAFCSADAKKVSDLLPSGTGIKWYSASTGGTLYTGTEVLATGTYFVSQTLNSCESTRTSVSVTVNTTPSAPAASAQTFCSADAKKVSDLLPSGTGIKWYSASTGGTLYAGTEVLATGTYFVSQTTNGCESTRTSVSVTVNTTPSAPAASAQTFCSADAKKVSDLLPSGTGIKWYSASTGGTLYTGTEVLATGTYFASQTTNGCESTRTSVSVTVNTTPSAPAASAQTFCSADAKKVSDLLPSGTGIKWYSASTGGTLYTGTEVLATGTYFASQTTNGCESARTSVSVTVNTTPSAPAASAQTFCSADVKKVSDLLPSGTGIKWYSASTGGTLYAGTEVLATGTYFVSQTISGCESARTLVSVTVNTTPSAPAASAQTFCSADAKKVSDLLPSGTGIKWYSASTGGTLYAGTEVLATGTYFVSQTTSGCESTRTSVSVTVNTTPSAPTASAQTFCSADAKKVSDLLPSGTGIKWYNASTGGTLYAGTEVLSTGTYFVSQTTNGCESTRTSVSVTVNTTPSAPAASAQTFCSADVKKVSDLLPSGTGIKWYSASTGGTLYAGTEVLATGTYFVSQTTNGCESTRTSVSVTVNTTPVKPTITANGATTLCSGESVILTSSSTTGNLWSTGETTQSITVTSSGNYNVTVTTLGCSSPVSDSTPVTVNPKPSKPIVNTVNQATCSGTTASVELSGLPAGNWTISPGNITGNTTTTTISGLLPGNTYNYTVTNSLGCESLPSSDVTISDYICAVNDTPSSVNGLTGGTISTVFVNDKVNGSSFLPTDVSLTTSTLPTGVTFNSDGTITIAPNTAAGTHTITYTICKSTNTSICDSATVEVVITAPAIDAVAEALTPSVNGLTGGNTTLSLINADTLNGVQAVIGTLPGNVTISGSGLPTGITINADGTVKVAPNTAAGTYNIQYSICEINNTSNCDSAVSTIVVTAPSIDAVAEALTPSVNGLTGGNTTLSLINADTLNGVQAVIGTLPGNVTISGSGLPTGITINTDGTVKVAPNTAAGTYNIQYSICEINNTSNCDSAVSTIVVTAPSIDAVAEALTPSVNGLTGGNTTLSLINADTLNGVQAVIGNLPGNVTISGSGLPTGITINTDGTVKVAPNTAAGTYNIQYSICEINNTSNCDSAVSTIVVTAPSIDAVAEALTPSVNGLTGGNTTLSLINADTLNGVQAVIGNLPGNVTISGSGLPTGITINTDGTVKVAPNTAAGTYNIQYSICEVSNSSNCDSAVSTITVTAPAIDAVAEALTPSVNGLTGGNTTLSLINADTLNGVQAVIGTLPGNVTISGSGLPTGITINTDGTVKVAPNTAAGTYNIQYSICEINNTSNCDSAVSTIVVTAPSIDAVAEALTPSVNGLTGGNTTLSLINADTLNGVQAVIGNLPGNVTISGSGLPTGITINTDGTVKVAPNTAAGTYNIQYSICEVSNSSNCDSAVSTITVTAPAIDAVAEALTPSVNGLTGGNTTLSLINADTLNGVQAVIGTLPGNVTISGSGLPTGITINTDGTVKVAPNTAAGTYNIQYSICEINNTSNCDSAVSTIVVTAPAIDAVAEALTPSVNGLTGGNTTLSLINADTLNGVQAVIGTLPGNVTISGSGLPTGITINTDGTVKVAPNTAAGTYNIQYSICEVSNSSNCDSAVSTITVTAPAIDAVAEALTPSVNGLTGGNTTLSLINADTLNGVQAVIGTLPGNVTISGSGLPTGITINTDGTVKVAPNTAAGTYNIQYSICEVSNTSNCDSAVSTVVVTAPSIDAVADALTPSVNGLTGGNTTLSLINADTLNGVQAVIGNLPGNVTISGSGLPTGITINTDGTVKVAPNTAAGTYNIQYSICEVNNTSNCDSAVSTIVVTAPSIDAVADALTPSVNGLTGGNTTLSLINADTLNGVQAVIGTLPGNVTISGSGLPTGITINADGTVKVAPNTAAGTYNIQYSICEINNTSNCDSAVSTIVVTAPAIDAVAEALTPSVNGLTGGNTTLSLINADTLNGVQAVIGTLPGNVTISGSGLPTGITINADGTVKVAPNTAAGTYNIQYSICEVSNTSNCDSVVSTITVTAPSIDAVAEALTPSVNGLTGGNTTLSLINADTLNGVQAVIGTLPGNVTISGSGLPTGITINADGTVKVAPNTAAGTYNIQYSICEINNTSNCDSAVSTITVTAPAIDAVADALTPSVNGLTGGNTTLSLINADTLNGVQAVIGNLPGNVTISGSGLPTGITINTDGTVKVAPNTAAGTYNIQYSICEVSNTSNCDSVVSTITVTAPSIDAVAEALTPSVNGLTGGNTTLSLINADTLNGVQAVIGTLPGNVTISGSGLPTGITINADGTVKVAPNTAAGTYNIQYSICEINNTSNCDSAVSTITVTAPAIDAVADALTPSVNGLTGGNTTLSLINADTLNGVQAVIGNLPGNVTISGSGLPTGITINTDGTVKVAPNTAAGTYNIQYSICEINNTSNCDSAVSTIVVTAPAIDAVAEALTPSVNGLTGGNTTLSLINADTLNGVQAVIGTLPGNVTISGSGLPTGITINTDGTVKVAPNTAAGTYNIQYSICEVSNSSNCDSAVSTITVTAPAIDAVAEALTPSVNGLTGGNTTLSLINADTLNGVQAVIGTLPGNVSIAGSGLPTGITINTDGTVKVAPNTAAGTYNIQYSICEINNTSNCDSAVSTIVVTAPSIDAVADALTPSVNGLTGGNTTLSLINADTLNGVQAVIGTLPGNVSIAGSGLPTGITINTDGTVKVAPNTAAGTYNIQYSICEINNTSNCDSAVSTIVVTVPPVIDAVTETTTAVNSNAGGTTVSLTANDKLNGNPVTVGTGAGEVSFTLVSTLPAGLTINADQTITVAPGTVSGSYEVEYTICDNDHASNCDTVKSYITVTGDTLTANADTPLAVTQSGTAQTIINVISNDTRNGNPLTASEVTITTTTVDPSGYLTLDPVTGVVSLGANAPAGTYTLTYSICDKTNTSNCSTASVTLTVNAPAATPVIDAVTETTTAVNSNAGGTTVSLTANDKLNGNPVTVGAGAGEVSFTLVSTLPAGLTINADQTITVAPGTLAGSYEVEYTICDNDHASNCDTVKSYITVTGDTLTANADTPLAVTQSGTAQTIINVISNDTRNGNPLTASEVTITTTTADPSGYLTLDPVTGVVSLGANAPAGTYTLTYSICDKTNTSNCSTASVTLTVNAPAATPVIDAVTETTTAVNSNAGGTTVSLTANDTLNGNPVTVGTGAGEVSFTLVSTLPAGLTINADQTITVAPGTLAGSYEVEYTICDNDHASNCDTVKSYITVTGDTLTANADTPLAVTQSGTAQTIINVISNDTRNGNPLTASEVTITTTTPDPSGYLTLDPVTGVVSLGANAPAGTYTLTYSICDKTNTSNCSTASVTLTVNAPAATPVIDAVTETTTAVNSNAGGTTVSLTANDTLNGNPVTVGAGAGEVSFTLVSTLPAGLTINADQTITVAPGTLAGSYEVEYTICDNDHASNCDTVKSYITVTGDTLTANADTPSAVTQSGTAQTIINVISNDTRNGNPLTASEVTITTTTPDPSGYLTLDPVTGVVSLEANAPAGTYTLTYSICDKTNTSNCSTASVTLTVNAPAATPVIDAVTETTTAVNSNAGGATVSLTANDKLNGNPVTVGAGAGEVSFTLVSTLPAGLTINAGQTITVAPGTLAGSYEVEYTICDNDHASNCDTVKSYITVTGDTLTANADTPLAVTQSGTAQTIINVISNDTRNGNPLTASEVTITTTTADPSGYLTLDPVTGMVSLGANAPAGTYTLTYSICDKTNTSNCSTASVTLTVNAPAATPVIDAVTETTTAVNSNAGGTTVSLTANDKLNGNPVTVGTGAGEVSFTLVSTLPAGLTINTDQTITVAPGTVSGSYEVEYTICDNDHASNCDTVKSYITVTGDTLTANADTPLAVTQSGTAQTIINVISNDTRNGNPLTASEVTITTTTADPSGYLTLDPVTGVVSLGANAPAGTYTLTYSICDKTNTSNCSTASVTLTVNAPAATPVIDAVTETTTAVNSNAGGTTVSLTANDKLNGNPVTVGTGAGEVSFTLVSTLPAGLTINADQTITVAPGTVSGSYEVEYTICDNDHASNCDTVKSYITVTGDTLTANADTPLAVTQSGTAQTIINVISNDTRNGNPLTASEVTITTTTADPSGYLTLDPVTGVVSLGANAPAGTYTLTYSICDKTNTSNCSTASVTLTVNAPAATPVIDAVTETTTAVNSNAGGTTVSLTANDKLNGNPVTVGAGAGEVSFTLVSTLPAGLTINADQTITVAPGTLAGSYEVEYTICDNDHASNCDTVKSYITVTGDTLTANADTPLAVTQSGTAQTIINVISNDTRNGNPLTASEVTITTTTADPSGYLTLDPVTGTVTLEANAPAGTYTLTYSICDKTNTSNCSTASVTLTVNAPTVILPVIIAVTENLGPINGTIGGATTSLIAGDTLNGLPAVIGSGAGQVTLSGTAPAGLTINADGTIKVDVNTPIGTYPVVYTICDNDHLSTNCATVTSYVVVTGADLVLVNDTAGPIAGVNHPVNVVNVLANDTKNGLPITANDVKLSESIADPKGYLTLNPDGTVVIKENAPAGTYELTYQVCELNTSNCATATVKVEVVAPTMTVTANSYCSNNVPYVSYNVVADNFTPNNLLTIKWIDSDNNVVLTQTDLPLSGNILWAGATIDANGKGTDWPGWILTNGQWTEGADGFEKTKPAVTMQFSLNPTVNVLVSYPAATSGCNARPTFTIKANDDVTGPIDTTKGVSTSLNIFDNDQLNALPIVPANIALTTIVPNANLILNADGSVDVKPQTPSGTYQLTYQICDLSSSSSNCSQAIVKVTVVNSVITLPNTIVATNDGVISVDGINGSLEFINVLDNDLFNGGAVNPIDVTISNTPANSHFEFNADGTVNVKPNTPAGNYALTYQICEKASGSNCATAVLNVFVEVPSIAIIKTAVFNDENGSGVANAGETITYKFTVTNTGNVPLTGVTVTDPLTGVVLSGQAINLDVNESNDSNFTAQYKITQADINRGNVSNQATVQGRSAKGVVVEDKSDDSSNSGDKPTVLELNGCVIKVFNAFSPNGDSKNTRFYIQGLECYPENTVEIYNRWGVLVFDMDHYNNEDKAFKGFSEGRATVKQSDGLPVGTYFYILKYKDSDSNPHELTGYLYVNK